VISTTGSTRKVEYLLKDRLGSVDAVASSAGAITETRGYDAFGKPRDGTWNDLNPARIASTAVTPKGFTQHEHLNQLELIHMNGRVYDYGLGRFTGVDPFIQFPLNSQSLNPYSYILNNPLSGTDPTGYAFRDIMNGQSEVGRFREPKWAGEDDGESNGSNGTDDVDKSGKPEGNGAKTGQTSGGSSDENGAHGGQSAIGADERGKQPGDRGDEPQNGAVVANQSLCGSSSNSSAHTGARVSDQTGAGQYLSKETLKSLGLPADLKVTARDLVAAVIAQEFRGEDEAAVRAGAVVFVNRMIEAEGGARWGQARGISQSGLKDNLMLRLVTAKNQFKALTDNPKRIGKLLNGTADQTEYIVARDQLNKYGAVPISQFRTIFTGVPNKVHDIGTRNQWRSNGPSHVLRSDSLIIDGSDFFTQE